MRGMDQLFIDMMTEKEPSDFLLDRITEIVTEAARSLAEADLDLLILGDDIAMQTGMMMSLDFWRQHLKPRLSRVIRAAKEVKPDIFVFYHSDGNVWDAIPDLIDAGVDVLNPVQPEINEYQQLAKEYGKDLAVMGGLDVQRLPRFSPVEIENSINYFVETFKHYHCGVIISPTNTIVPETPIENIEHAFQVMFTISHKV
jgi:uroporphyrinogen decarboxylase